MQQKRKADDEADGAPQQKKQRTQENSETRVNSNQTPVIAKKSVYDIPLEQIIPVLVESKEHMSEIVEVAVDSFGTLQKLVATINDKSSNLFKKTVLKECTLEFVSALEVVQVMRMCKYL